MAISLNGPGSSGSGHALLEPKWHADRSVHPHDRWLNRLCKTWPEGVPAHKPGEDLPEAATNEFGQPSPESQRA